MKQAIICDIHANLEALQAVLNDIKAQGVQQTICLGDVVGFGTNPCECVDLVIEHCAWTILGEFDQATLFDPDGFTKFAKKSVYWTREQLECGPGSTSQVSARWDFLGELPRTHTDGDFLFIHGSPRDPTAEYVMPEDVRNPRKVDAWFARVKRYCFLGHSHIAGIFTRGGPFLIPEDVGDQYRLGPEPVMINVGSVGIPRNHDPRACYDILDDDLVTFRRVDYTSRRASTIGTRIA